MNDLKRRFVADGFVKVERFLPEAEVAALRADIAAEVACYDGGQRDDDSRYIFARTNHIFEISNLFKILPRLADLSVHRRVAATAAELIGAPGLRLYHDALLEKRPEHAAVPWHQDEFFSVLEGEVITAWMPLVPVDRDRGALVYARASDRDGMIDRDAFSGDDAVSAFLAERGYEQCAIAMNPGDVLFHNGRVFHRSEVNNSDVSRIAVSVFMYVDGACVREARFGRPQLVDMIYFPGCTVGDVADTDLNPLLFTART